MKILVIGKEGRLSHYTADEDKLKRYDIVYVPNQSDDKTILEAGADADIILVDAISPVTAQVIEAMPNLKLIHSEGVAFNRIDTEAAKNKGVYVCNCKGMNDTAVAEQTILLMLGLLRDVCIGDRAVREGLQITKKENYMFNGSLMELRDCTVGLVGFGDIAKATALLLKAFGARVVYYARTRKTESEEKAYGVTYRELGDLLKESDIVSLHVPVTDSTLNLANAEFFRSMKAGAYFVNTSRGELVDESALLEAIGTGHIAGAGLDTIKGEPVKVDNYMLQAKKEVADRIIYSPHIGGITASSFARGYAMFWRAVEQIESGSRPEHIVNGL